MSVGLNFFGAGPLFGGFPVGLVGGVFAVRAGRGAFPAVVRTGGAVRCGASASATRGAAALFGSTISVDGSSTMTFSESRSSISDDGSGGRCGAPGFGGEAPIAIGAPGFGGEAPIATGALFANVAAASSDWIA